MNKVPHSFDTAIIGNGPAAIGPFIASDREGNIQALLEKGVVMFGDTPHPGAGALRYGIRSNSPAKDFLDPVSPTGAFAEVLTSEEATPLQRNLKNIVDLKLVGQWIDVIGRTVHQLLHTHPSCAYMQQRVQSVLLQRDGTKCIVTEQGEKIAAQHIVYATGGKQKQTEGVWKTAHAVLSRPSLLGEISPDQEFVHILGGSHSAFSVAHLLLQSRSTIQICIHHRSPVRLFYDLQEEQNRIPQEYTYTEQDICSATQRLHRFGGLRGDARELYVRVLRGEEQRLKMLQSATPCSSCVIDARGYQASTVPLYYSAQEEKIPLHCADGQVEVDPETCTIISANGEKIDGVFGTGLGFGLRPNDREGEMSFRGRLDGVNVYWGMAGERIVSAILKSRSALSSSSLPLT